MRYIFNTVCVTYSIVFINSRCNKITQHEKLKKQQCFKQYELPISAVFFIFGTTGNIIIIMLTTCNKTMRTVPNMYFLKLAISDIFYLTVLFSEHCKNANQDMTIIGDSLCAFYTFCYQMSIGLTANSIAVLNIKRYSLTVNPLKVRTSSQKNGVQMVLGFAECEFWLHYSLFLQTTHTLFVLLLYGVGFQTIINVSLYFNS